VAGPKSHFTGLKCGGVCGCCCRCWCNSRLNSDTFSSSSNNSSSSNSRYWKWDHHSWYLHPRLCKLHPLNSSCLLSQTKALQHCQLWLRWVCQSIITHYTICQCVVDVITCFHIHPKIVIMVSTWCCLYVTHILNIYRSFLSCRQWHLHFKLLPPLLLFLQLHLHMMTLIPRFWWTMLRQQLGGHSKLFSQQWQQPCQTMQDPSLPWVWPCPHWWQTSHLLLMCNWVAPPKRLCKHFLQGLLFLINHTPLSLPLNA